jgi:hypothetical protein
VAVAVVAVVAVEVVEVGKEAEEAMKAVAAMTLRCELLSRSGAPIAIWGPETGMPHGLHKR